MVKEIELSTLDMRYEGCRMRQQVAETRLMASIAERGIAEPLEGVNLGSTHVLLNGFKRWRCARKLGITTVQYVSLGEDAAMGIVALLRLSNDKALSLLEQAGFVDELKRLHAMSLAEIAEVLSRSKAWVSLRLGLIAEMSPAIRQKLFAGDFPVYAYMYNVRSFMRINGTGKAEAEQFVTALSGKRLSVRDIEHLAHGYFRGTEAMKAQIRLGNVALPLEQMKRSAQAADGCTPFEQGLLRDIDIVQKYMQRVAGKSSDERVSTSAFKAQASLLLGGLLNRSEIFFQSVRQLNDRC